MIGLSRLKCVCDCCFIEFFSLESLLKHKKHYCYRRNKLPRSSTITSEVLAEESAENLPFPVETSPEGQASNLDLEGMTAKLNSERKLEESRTTIDSRKTGGCCGTKNNLKSAVSLETSILKRKRFEMEKSSEQVCDSFVEGHNALPRCKEGTARSSHDVFIGDSNSSAEDTNPAKGRIIENGCLGISPLPGNRLFLHSSSPSPLDLLTLYVRWSYQ